jgi:phosphoserine phosphatase
MPLSLTLVSPDASAVEAVAEDLGSCAFEVKSKARLGPAALDIALAHDQGEADALRASLKTAIAGRPVDFCLQAQEGRRKALLVADMDSTIISCECLDELADYAGVKAEIAAITERAMRGELTFEPALRERVSRLAGLPVARLQQCYDERVRLNPGAEILVKTMVRHGARAVLVSGGFEFFTSRVARAAGFSDQRGNRLEEAEERLTGKVIEPILGREAKLAALREEAEQLGAPLASAIAMGDGANDLAMIEAAGLGVAYRAKPVVAERAHCAVDHADLTAVLYFQGYRFEEFAPI